MIHLYLYFYRTILVATQHTLVLVATKIMMIGLILVSAFSCAAVPVTALTGTTEEVRELKVLKKLGRQLGMG